ncbi:MAG: adenylyltransferase/cytidyltransferase family protein [Candidatus Pacebacteria bacterium]|nr:adenylyltransferase/cytidyltransferase family protein [Candidatus Paceibacterota bacterium]MCF7856955.1 adenylyltransferase/cytidyltransferase family protein [Candidatus Paceibacterota bacterium]
MKRITISGGFDPIHPGHIAMIEDAKKFGEVHVIVNSDDWLIRKKGFFFQPWTDRKKILEAYTPHVYDVDDSDGTVCEALRRIRPDYFGNGGDRGKTNTPELNVCEELGIEPVFELGGGKYSSSSALNAKQRVSTRWGWFDVILDMHALKVKMLHIEAGKSLSLQKHGDRSEFFFMPTGEVRVNLPGVWHVLEAPSDQDLDVLEVQMGISAEEDIDKIHETHESFDVEKVKKILLNR